MTAECRVSGLDVTTEQDYEAPVSITDTQGDVVAAATARWRLRPIPRR